MTPMGFYAFRLNFSCANLKCRWRMNEVRAIFGMLLACFVADLLAILLTNLDN